MIPASIRKHPDFIWKVWTKIKGPCPPIPTDEERNILRECSNNNRDAPVTLTEKLIAYRTWWAEGHEYCDKLTNIPDEWYEQ